MVPLVIPLTIGTNGNADGTIRSPNGTIGTIVQPYFYTGTVRGSPNGTIVPLAYHLTVLLYWHCSGFSQWYHWENPEQCQYKSTVGVSLN